MNRRLQSMWVVVSGGHSGRIARVHLGRQWQSAFRLSGSLPRFRY